jgi:hypothetical protein
MTGQRAFWNHYTIYNTHRDNHNGDHNDRPKRSESRQRTERVHVRLLPSELDVLETAAQRAHISVAELLRRAALHHTDTAVPEGSTPA